MYGFLLYGLITRVGSVEDYVNHQAAPEITTQAPVSESIPETTVEITQKSETSTVPDTRSQQEKRSNRSKISLMTIRKIIMGL